MVQKIQAGFFRIDRINPENPVNPVYFLRK